MGLQREIQRLGAALMLGFALIALTAFYWAALDADSLLSREDNPRLMEAEQILRRGTLMDRNEVILAESRSTSNNRLTRVYPEHAAFGVVGYSSLTYGVGGAEAAFDAALRGDDLSPAWERAFSRDVLHIPQQGADLRLTLDMRVQQVAVDQMTGLTGALVALSVPDGGVLALLSLPAYDPNTLDDTWERLRDDPTQPIFNRALQGQYQPGGVLQTALLTAAYLEAYPMAEPLPGASAEVVLNGLTLRCAARPPADRLLLSEAYGFGCPAPFAKMIESVGSPRIETVFELFAFDSVPMLEAGYVSPDNAVFNPESALGENTAPLTLADALGQGRITVTPLQMAAFTGAMINSGNAPTPYTLLARREPGQANWTPLYAAQSGLPITTTAVSQQVQAAMREATISGAAYPAASQNASIAGHVALAYSGDSTLTWFTGLTITGPGEGVSIAVVIEDSSDVRRAAQIGGDVLLAAYNSRVNFTD